MLRELHITGVAVLEDVRLDLGPGLICLTGMTGAGKSLVVHALEVLLGLRPASGMLQPGCHEGRIVAVFEVGEERSARSLARVLDLVDAPKMPLELVLSRKLSASGRSSATANGAPVTTAMLQQAADWLIDIHGQSDHELLLRPARQLELLDAFAGLEGLREAYAEVWSRWREARRRLTELQSGEALRCQQLELFRFQRQEIDAAQLQPGEFAHWTQLARRLSGLERLRAELTGVLTSLEADENAVVDRARRAAATLSALGSSDAALHPLALSLREASVILQEAARDLTRYVDRLEPDPETLAAAQDRLTLIGRLATKYATQPFDRLARSGSHVAGLADVAAGTTDDEADPVASVLAYRRHLEHTMAELEAAQQDFDNLEREVQTLHERCRSLAIELTTRRHRAASLLESEIRSSLAELGMPRAVLRVQVEPLGDAFGPAGVRGTPTNQTQWPSDDVTGRTHDAKARSDDTDSLSEATLGPTGGDRVEFVASMNPGLPPAPLRKIASGGELSRVLLAVRSALASRSGVATLIFDEVDANVGGRLGLVIGRKLGELARERQVLCITHLPQLACFADRHFVVRKSQTSTRTGTTVARLDEEDRISELADMLGGDGPTARAQARELLRVAAAELQVSSGVRSDRRSPSDREVGASVSSSASSAPLAPPTAPATAQPVQRRETPGLRPLGDERKELTAAGKSDNRQPGAGRPVAEAPLQPTGDAADVTSALEQPSNSAGRRPTSGPSAAIARRRRSSSRLTASSLVAGPRRSTA